jgi:replicative DNA helicase
MMDTRQNLEQIIIGSCLIDPKGFTLIKETLQVNDFHLPEHALVYACFASLTEKRVPIDLVTLFQELKSRGENYDLNYIMDLNQKVGTASNIEYHARILKQYSLGDKLSNILNESSFKAKDERYDVFETIDETQNKLNALNLSFARSKMSDFTTIAKETLGSMQESLKNPQEATGIMTGIHALDERLKGLNAPDVTVIAAGVGEGKSTLALQIALNIAKQNIPVAFFSLEMKAKQLMYKIFSGIIDEQITTVRQGKIADDKYAKLAEFIGSNSEMPLYLEDNGGLSLNDLIATARYLVSMKGIKVIIIDYLQLMSTVGCGMKFASRELEVSHMTREVKRLAMDLNISIIELSQFSRMEKGTKRLYAKSDLRESGSIEANADNILAIYRPSEHGGEQIAGLENYHPYPDEFAVIQVLKQRLGKVGMFPINFNGAFNRFEEIEGQAISSNTSVSINGSNYRNNDQYPF